MNEVFIFIETLNHFSPTLTCATMAGLCVMVWRFEKRVLSLEMKLREIFLEKKDFWEFIDRMNESRKDV